jgi:hypothetical protein
MALTVHDRRWDDKLERGLIVLDLSQTFQFVWTGIHELPEGRLLVNIYVEYKNLPIYIGEIHKFLKTEIWIYNYIKN